MKHRLPPLLAWAAVLLLLAGCAGMQDVAQSTIAPPETETRETSPSQTSKSSTLTLAYTQSAGFNPFSCMDLTNRTLLSLVYESLFRVTSDFQAAAYLCDTYTASGDGRTHTITLRDKIAFSDGSAMTAADVVASLQAARGSPFYTSRFYHVTGASAKDDRTIIITTDTAYDSLALLLDVPIVKSGTAGSDVPVGSGPFVPDLGKLQLTRSSAWWQSGSPVIQQDAIPLFSSGSSSGLRDAFEFGKVSLVCTDPNAGSSNAYHADYELWNNNTTIMQYVGFNLNSPVFTYSPIRSAVTYLIDRDAIVSGCAGGFAIPATLPASPASARYDQKLAANYAYNPAAFSDAMAASEIGDLTGNDGILDVYTGAGSRPLAGKMIVCNTSDERVAAAQAVADSLNKAGFSITLSALDAGGYAAALNSGSYDLYYGETRLSANFDLTPFFSASGSLSFGGIADQTLGLLCTKALENAGNAYDLHQKIMERGLLCPVLFKTYAICSARGVLTGLAPCLDCVFSAAS